jgi:hypothetical protein
MSYSKTIPLGTVGSIVIAEASGNATVTLALTELSGGSFPGVAKAVVSAEVEVDGKTLIDLGLALISAKYPSASAIITGLEGIINAGVASV